MRCYICDKRLEPNEIKLDKDGTYKPCNTCLKEIKLMDVEETPLDILPDMELLEDALKNYD